MQVFVELEGVQVDLAARKEVDGPFIVLNFYVLVIAHEEASLRQLENVLFIANGADDLARSRVHVRLFCDGRSLDLLGNTAFTQRVSAEQHTW